MHNNLIQMSTISRFLFSENVIGLKGLQMFVDAGVPIDRNLVDELIRSVLIEMLETMYGYPPPFKCDDPQVCYILDF